MRPQGRQSGEPLVQRQISEGMAGALGMPRPSKAASVQATSRHCSTFGEGTRSSYEMASVACAVDYSLGRLTGVDDGGLYSPQLHAITALQDQICM